MPIKSPAESHACFTKAFNAADRAALTAYYTADAKLVLGPGQEHVGTSAIAAALEGFLAIKGRMTIETLYAVEHGDTALTRGKWRLQGTAPDGKPIAMEGSNVEVLRRQADGTWKCAIDLPFGGNV